MMYIRQKCVWCACSDGLCCCCLSPTWRRWFYYRATTKTNLSHPTSCTETHLQYSNTQRKREKQQQFGWIQSTQSVPWLISGVHMHLNFLHMHTDAGFKERVGFKGHQIWICAPMNVRCSRWTSAHPSAPPIASLAACSLHIKTHTTGCTWCSCVD